MIGLDVVGRFAPTLSHTSRVTLHTSGRVEGRLRTASGIARVPPPMICWFFRAEAGFQRRSRESPGF